MAMGGAVVRYLAIRAIWAYQHLRVMLLEDPENREAKDRIQGKASGVPCARDIFRLLWKVGSVILLHISLD